MRFADGRATGWVELEMPAEADPAMVAASKSARLRMDRQLLDISTAENLVVLCGLGTSLCIVDGQGSRKAPTMGDLWEGVKAATGNDFEGVQSKVRYPTDAGKNIERLLSHCQLSQTLAPDSQVERFIERAETVIVEKCNFLDAGTALPTHETFLRKVARRSTRLPRMKLFTTNYDLSFEAAAGRSRFTMIDGFSHTIPQEFDGVHFNYDYVKRHPEADVPDFIPNVFQFLKLHGSIDWTLDGKRVVKKPAADSPMIIYPRDTKFQTSYEQPFLELMSRFQSSIRLANTGLLIVGFGFNDAHLSEPILSAIRSNVSMKVMVVDPVAETGANPYLTEIRGLMMAGDTRLALLAAKFEDLVALLPDLVAPTEEEYHTKRLRGVPLDG